MEHPLEGEAPAGQQREVVVARARRAVVDLVAQQVRDRQLLRADGEQRREHVGHAVAQQVAQPRQEGVRVPHLRRPAALPALEGRHRIGGEGRGVALEQRDLVAGPREEERRTEPTDAAADHHRAHESLLECALAAQRREQPFGKRQVQLGVRELRLLGAPARACSRRPTESGRGGRARSPGAPGSSRSGSATPRCRGTRASSAAPPRGTRRAGPGARPAPSRRRRSAGRPARARRARSRARRAGAARCRTRAAPGAGAAPTGRSSAPSPASPPPAGRAPRASRGARCPPARADRPRPAAARPRDLSRAARAGRRG